MFFSSYTSNSRDVMVLLNNNFEQKVERVKTDKNGNFIILDIVVQGKRMTTANVYVQIKMLLFFIQMLFKKLLNLKIMRLLYVETGILFLILNWIRKIMCLLITQNARR